MIDPSQLLKDLQSLVRELETDLLERSAELPDITARLKEEYTQANEAKRTALSYEEWRSDYITQMAVAWVLTTVFVRFLEDNQLIDTLKISGVGEGLTRARDEHELYFRNHPTETDRDYLLDVFSKLAKLPGLTDILQKYNLIRNLSNWLSGDGAGKIIQFFQKIDSSTGNLVHDFTDSTWDTRFLGDLYQDLSEATRKRYALLQTPVFVEEFILDRTLEPAIKEFGLEGLRMIDPACGSGHFLLGSLHHILEKWQRQAPAVPILELAQRALNSVYGVDINPYAVAIARFRLLLVVLQECGVKKLKNAPAFKINLACGDSLLHGTWMQLDLDLGEPNPNNHYFQVEDRQTLNQILEPKSYHAVVANPPYITPKDKALNQAYRQRYSACHRQYSLAVPFMERIFELAVPGGFTGQITANSFMKREFGKKLIEGFFPKVDLTHVIDTSGAYIPGHGTPTVILLGRNRKPVASTIRTVMGIRGEPSTPNNAREGLVWTAIVNQVDVEGSESEFVSAADSERASFHKHPWSIGGGGASELKEYIDSKSNIKLANIATEIGFICITKADEIFPQSLGTFLRYKAETKYFKPFGIGEEVRDWFLISGNWVIFPYDENINTISLQTIPLIQRFLWSYRTELYNRKIFGGKTYKDAGKPWYEYGQIPLERIKIPLSIVFAFVASHNHFVLDRGGKVFKQTAPVIKLAADATEDDHLALLGLLNSSTACFWGRQTFFPKGGFSAGKWEERLEWDSSKLKQFPIPKNKPLALSQKLDELAQKLTSFTPDFVLKNYSKNLKDSLEENHHNWKNTLEMMIFWQEELDWQCYQYYELITEDLTYKQAPVPLQIGQRAFEIIMGQQIAKGELESSWFERHNSQSITELPNHWVQEYQQLVTKRIELIKTKKNIRLIEKPEYKRRWTVESWESQLETALRTWLLDRLESYFDFDGRMDETGNPTAKIDISLISIAKLADIARKDSEFMEIGELYRQDNAFDVQKLVQELVEKETVPLLPVLRYKPSGLRKRQEWEKTWELQRLEDAIDARTKLDKDKPDHLDFLAAEKLKTQEIGKIPVPAKYTSKDFLKQYWRLRGKLDVPKERWVSFPHCEGEDGTLVIAWAGYDHLQLAQSISAYFVEIQERIGGSADFRLQPLLGCLIELLPWLKQWHNDIDPKYGLKMGDYFEGFIQEEARRLEKTPDNILNWQPPKQKTRKRKK